MIAFYTLSQLRVLCGSNDRPRASFEVLSLNLVNYLATVCPVLQGERDDWSNRSYNASLFQLKQERFSDLRVNYS